MDDQDQDQAARKPRTTRPRLSVRAETRKPARKEKHTLMFDGPTWRRLTVHAAHLGIDRSALNADLINSHLRRFVVSDRDKPADGETAAA